MAKHYENIELHGNLDIRNNGEIKNLRIERVAVLPPFVSLEEGRQVYLLSDKNIYINDGLIWKVAGGDASPGKTILYISDITPTTTGNVFNKILDGDSVSLVSCSSDTQQITIHFITETGNIPGFKPAITVNGSSSTLTSTGTGEWSGTANISMGGSGNIMLSHPDGTTYTLPLTIATGPVISSAILTGYPVGQTELKAGDQILVSVSANQPMTEIEFIDNGNVANIATIVAVGNTTNIVVGLTIADRGTTTQTFGVLLRAKNANGSYGPTYNTSIGGSSDGSHTVKLNNIYPSININSITYPVTQQALKNSESVSIDNTITNYNTITYSSPTNELSIPTPTVYSATKTVSRISGNYNVATNNFRISATRTANNATTEQNAVVKIANVAPTVSVILPAARLRSGGNNGTSIQNHIITLSSNQQMLIGMSVDAPIGTWTGAWSGTQTSTRTLQIHDNDTKGTYAFTNLSATNLAGITQTIITDSNYVIGGFVLRNLTVPSISRETGIGTTVADVTKLRCTNLSKGLTGSLNYSFVPNVGNAIDNYTITSPTNTYNQNGNLWYNRDENNTLSNTTGSIVIELEELV